jgi:nitrogen fixation protein NifB
MTIIRFPPKDSTCRDPGVTDHGISHPGLANLPSGRTTLILPVAPRSFFRIRFDRTDQPARAIPPSGALRWLEENHRQGAGIQGVELDGPGDPLADIDCTLETLRLIGGKYPQLKRAVATLGLHGGKYAEILAAAGVSEVILLVDAVSRELADKLYAWIRPANKTLPLARAIPLLLEEQAGAAKTLKAAGLAVTVRTTVYPGINDGHIAEIARAMAGCGVEAMQLVPCGGSGSDEEALISPPSPELMQRLRENGAKYLVTTIATGKERRLGADCSSPSGAGKSPAMQELKPSKARPNVGVVSMGGMEVDLHLGQAYQVLIYGPREDGLISLLSNRPVPEPGSGSSRWEELAGTLTDCFALLAASAGENPRRILAEHGITVLITDSEIEGGIDLLYGGGKKKGKVPECTDSYGS